MIFCECPICDEEMNLRGYKANEVIKCPECQSEVEIVSLKPPVLEEPFRDDDDWDEDDDDWDEDEDDDWDEDEDDNWKEKDDEDWDY